MDQTIQASPDNGGTPAGLACPTKPPRPARLGEELPVFCERCGYCLHGLPQARCEQCDILQFRCPECGHRQPINTLRPAVQRILGRIRACVLGLVVLVKLNYFLWLLFAWGAMGYEWSFQYRWQNPVVMPVSGRAGTINSAPRPVTTYAPRALDWEAILAFSLFALAFGMVSRMLLLRWQRGAWVGAILGGLAGLAVVCGMLVRQTELARSTFAVAASSSGMAGSPFGEDRYAVLVITCGCILLGAMMVWPLWTGCVRLFLPQRTGTALLEWQNSLSAKEEQKKPRPEPGLMNA